jgi:OHCU decarboxylase
MHVDDVNTLPRGAAVAELMRCCGSSRWAALMADRRPFASLAQIVEAADEIWWALAREDWLEAFSFHPRIGGIHIAHPVPDAHKLDRSGAGASPQSARGSTTSVKEEAWPALEQAGMNQASDDVRCRLIEANRDYEARFGYIFIVCATGKSAAGMLAMLEARLSNRPDDELRVAAEQQRQITRIRLAKLFDSASQRDGPSEADRTR